METSRKSSGRAAVPPGQHLRPRGNDGDARTWEPNAAQIPWRAWRRGAALIFWLLLGMYILERRYCQDAHAAATTQAERLQRERGGETVKQNVGTEPILKDLPLQKDWASHRPFRGSVSTSLPVLPVASQQPAVRPAWVKRGTNVARTRGVEADGQSTGITEAGATLPWPQLHGGSAPQGHGLDSDKLQAQRPNIDLDYSYTQKSLFQHPTERAMWNWARTMAISTAIDNAAELVRKPEHEQAIIDEDERTDEEVQRRRLVQEVHNVLYELVKQPLHSLGLRGNRRVPNATDDGAKAPNHPRAHEAKNERIGFETTEGERANEFAAADAAGRLPSAAGDSLSLSTAEDETFWRNVEGSESENTLLNDAADSKKDEELLTEVSGSLTQDKALQHLLELPLDRRYADPEAAEDRGSRIVGNLVGEDAEVQEDERRPRDFDKVPAPTGHTDVLLAGEGKKEEILNNAGVLFTSRASSLANQRRHSHHAPHHVVCIMPRGATDAAAEPEAVRRSKPLTLSELETLLRTRSQQHPRRSSSRPMIFPSCFFNAPMQKRMRARASALTAALEQLNDAVEALTELSEVVEKQAEAVEKAAFTLVYHDRLINEPVPMTKSLVSGDAEKGEMESELHTRQTGDSNAHPAFEQTPNNERSTVKERQEPAPPPELHQDPDATPEGPPEYQELQIHDKYRRLVGANGVRKQLKELFASWELARRAAGASEMANEIMRRAETLRREFAMPLQQDVQHLNFLDADLSPDHVAVQRLAGCKGFIKAVRRTVSRAEEELYYLGAHAFANEVSLPLMAHDLQHHLADLLEHVVQLQVQHHRALHMRAASLQALQRTFFKSARQLQQDATRRLKDTRLLLSTSPEEWHKLAQHLGSNAFALRVDLARQLVALRSVDKKAARLEGILTFLQEGLEHLLQVEGQLQQISRIRHYWPVVDDEEIKNEVSAQTEANNKPAEGSMEGLPPFDTENNADTIELTWESQQHLYHPDHVQSRTPFQQSRAARTAGKALLLDLPPPLGGHTGFTSMNKDSSGDAPQQDEGKSTRILQRLLVGVTQMWKYLQMYKRQSSDAELLLRSRFRIAQESVQKATLVAQMIMAQSHVLDRKQKEENLRENLPFLVQSVQRKEVERAQAEAAVDDSVAHVAQLRRKVRLLYAALSFIEDSVDEESPATGREVIARIDRINDRLFLNAQPDAEESKRSHEIPYHQDETEVAEEAFSEGSAGAGDGGNTTDKDPDTTRELLESELAATLEALQEAQYRHAQRRQELDTVEAALRQNRMSLEVHLRILDEIREATGPRLSRVTTANNRRGVVQMPSAESVGVQNLEKFTKETRKGQHIFATGGSLGAAAGAQAVIAARGIKIPVLPRTPEHRDQNTKMSTATGGLPLHQMSHTEQKPARQNDV